MPVENLHRGLYSIRLYRAQLHLEGEFEWPEPPLPNGSNPRLWKQAYIGLFVRDPRGIKTISSGTSSKLLATASEKELAQFPVREHLGAYAAQNAGTPAAFTYDMTLVGTSSLNIVPVGDRNEIRLASDWPHPSFGEAWSPDERGIGPGGFTAVWRITTLATRGRPPWHQPAAAAQIPTAAGARRF